MIVKREKYKVYIRGGKKRLKEGRISRNCEKDLEVLVGDKLKMSQHHDVAAKKANTILSALTGGIKARLQVITSELYPDFSSPLGKKTAQFWIS